MAYLVNCLLYPLPPPFSNFRQAQTICPTLLAQQQPASQGVWQLCFRHAAAQTPLLPIGDRHPTAPAPPPPAKRPCPRLAARAAGPAVLPPSTPHNTLSAHQATASNKALTALHNKLTSYNPHQRRIQKTHPGCPKPRHPLSRKPAQPPLPPSCSQLVTAPNPQPVAPRPSHPPNRQVRGISAFPRPLPRLRDVSFDSSPFKGASERPEIQHCTHSPAG